MEVVNEKTGDTIFHTIISKGLEETRIFCERGDFHKETLEVSNKLKQRPLHIAVAAHNIGLVQYLLKKGAGVDAYKKGDWTSLMIACTVNKSIAVEIAKLLIAAGANCKLKNKDGWTGMHIACKYGNTELIELLAITEPSLIWEPSRNQRLSIHIAALNMHTASVSLLIHLAGPKICSVKDACGSIPAMDAVSAGSEEILDILSAYVDIRLYTDKFGLNCLHKAAQMGHTPIIEKLVNNHGFNINEASATEGNTPLHYAGMEGKIDAVRTLLKFGANVALKNKYKQSVIELTRGIRRDEMVKIINEVTTAQHFKNVAVHDAVNH